jgi:hypothetical protein
MITPTSGFAVFTVLFFNVGLVTLDFQAPLSLSKKENAGQLAGPVSRITSKCHFDWRTGSSYQHEVEKSLSCFGLPSLTNIETIRRSLF